MEKKDYDHSDSYDCYVNYHGYGIDFIIYESGYEQCHPKHCWGPSKRNYHIIHYVLKGKGKLFVNKRSYDCKAGDLIYMSPEDTIYYEADMLDPWAYKWVGFDGMRAKAILEDTLLAEGSSVISVQDGKIVEKYLDAIFQSFQGENISNLRAIGNLYLLFAWLSETYAAPKVKEKLSEQEMFYSMLRYVWLHYDGRIKVSQIANVFNYDRTTVYKFFQKYLNMSPSQYIEKLRLKRACELIQKHKITMAQVAYKVGFNSYEWFFTVFKKNLNMSPQEFLSLQEVERLDFMDNRFKEIDEIMERHREAFNDTKIL